MHWGAADEARREEVRAERLGFWRASASGPAAWAVLAFSPAYAAPCRLAAACVPALLAGVPLLGAVCLGGVPAPSACVSLELTGMEDIFTLDVKALRRLLAEIGPGPGRLALLHRGELAEIAAAARQAGIPCWEERRPPTLSMPDPAPFDLDALAFAHGADVVPVSGADAGRADALYLSPDAARQAVAVGVGDVLALAPGSEGFWLHSGLSPAFFRRRALAFGPL